MKKISFRIVVVSLVFILLIVSFYMLYVHVPHYNYHHNLTEIRNEICEENNYEYMDYFFEYRGKEKYYLIKVKIEGVLSYVAYNDDKELIKVFQGEVAQEDEVIKTINDKYKVDVEKLDIAYENNKFLYYTKIQSENELMYIFYDLASGDFVKAYRL